MLIEHRDDSGKRWFLAKPTSTTGKYVISGATVEEYLFASPRARHLLSSQTKSKSEGLRRKLTPEQQAAIQLRSAKRAKQQLKRLVDANFKEWQGEDGKVYTQKFLTFTFAENLQDLEKANGFFTAFIKRFNWHIFHDHTNKLKYIAVHEIQKRGAIHYHAIFFNLPYMRNDRIAQIWGHGFTKTKKISSIKNVGAYLAKYLTKDSSTPRKKGQKRYFASRFLRLPMKVQDAEKVRNISQLLKNQPAAFEFKTDKKAYTQYTYRVYDLGKRTQLKESVLECAKQQI